MSTVDVVEDGVRTMTLTEGSDAEIWQRTIEKVIRSVVSLRYAQPHSFDGDLAGVSEATGFVVDAETGYILTNRHVVGTGPFWGRAVFHNQEEADIYPVYRDPVHDFGILRYEPRASPHIDAVPLELRPDIAEVGLPIKVIGNDAGERLSILSGFISRIDRNTPHYSGIYRDFNTCYYQANAAATGGSSGSPVVNIDGCAVALQAGGRLDKASTDYFLPLDAPFRALHRIKSGLPVTRGDVQCRFVFKPLEECRRLGLTATWETEVRAAHPKTRNMLVAETVIAEGLSDGKIKEGDIVLKVNGKIIATFQQLENLLDAAVEAQQTAHFVLQRGNSEIEHDVSVGDLHKITPDRFVSVAGAGFHNLSYQIAVRYGVPCKGVYMCESGNNPEFGGRCGYLIQSVNNKDAPDLDQFVDIMKDLPDKARVTFGYKALNDKHTLHNVVITLNRRWPAAMKMVTRNDVSGQWDFEVVADPLPAIPPQPLAAPVSPSTLHPAVREISRAMVAVSCKMPIYLEGLGYRHRKGMGLAVDAARGIVLVSTVVVPHSFCDIEITIAGSILVNGKFLFIHPTHGYTLVQYDPALVLAEIPNPTFAAEDISQGIPVMFAGHSGTKNLTCTPTTITRIVHLTIPPLSPPCYRPMNLDSIGLDTRLGSDCDSGAVMSLDGKVLGIWLTCKSGNNTARYGLAAQALATVLAHVQDGDIPEMRIPPAEFSSVSVADARAMGLSEEWMQKVGEKDSRHQLLMVKRLLGGRSKLKERDVLLTLNGELVTKAADIDAMYWNETVDLAVLRNSSELSLEAVDTIAYDTETAHAVSIGGLTLARPHLAVRQQIKDLPSEVYITACEWGSPGSMCKDVYATSFITHINNAPTDTLDDVLRETLKVPDNTYFRIGGVSFHSVPFVATLKRNDRWFPIREWHRDVSAPDGWRQTTYQDGETVEGEGLYGLPY
ncbi:trypsin-like cysteine/serine peptidase domain-containing protein [Lasiosphaeria ovina]|uniref:Pro-apoptotic serine protease NMA111 n=1 Tax=Lasiosphaeria ovina TaxID=92902 RepID=A0AAE0K4C0_9PEZI|nr:trypsin-like cysteine/serine peptidase domain-containing protein [Lasiosphaeria ovina]